MSRSGILEHSSLETLGCPDTILSRYLKNSFSGRFCMRTPDFSCPPWVETVEEPLHVEKPGSKHCLEKEGPIYKYLHPPPKKPQYWPPYRQSISVVFKISLFRASRGGPLPFSFSVLFTELEAVSIGGTKRKEGTNGVKKMKKRR